VTSDPSHLPAAIFIAVAVLAANVPWLTERVCFVFKPPGGVKRAWVRWLEWLGLYFVVGLLGFGIERKLTGERHTQDWEFYVVTLFLFLVFALPGFIYRHEFRRHWRRSTERRPSRSRQDPSFAHRLQSTNAEDV
jgi:hypothetical protein